MKCCVVPRMAIEYGFKSEKYMHGTFVVDSISKEEFCILLDINPDDYPFEYNIYDLQQEQGMRLQPYIKHKLDFSKRYYYYFATNAYEPYTEELAKEYPTVCKYMEVAWFLNDQIVSSELLNSFIYHKVCRMLKIKANDQYAIYGRQYRVHRDYARILQPYMQHQFDFEKYKYYVSTTAVNC